MGVYAVILPLETINFPGCRLPFYMENGSLPVQLQRHGADYRCITGFARTGNYGFFETNFRSGSAGRRSRFILTKTMLYA